MRSEAGIAEAAGYADRPHDFADLIHILDNEFRLITPTDPTGSDDKQHRFRQADVTTNSPTITSSPPYENG